MLFADTMAIFFVILGLLISFPSLWLLSSGLFPDFVAQTSCLAEKSLWKSFFLGIPIVAVAIVFIAVIGKFPGSFGQIGGVLSFAAWMIYAQVGVAGLAALIGRRLRSPADLDRPWKGTLRGGVVLVLSYLLPFVGWFLVLPASVIIGAGSSTRACFVRVMKRLKSAKAKTTSAAQTVEPDAAQPDAGSQTVIPNLG